MTDNAKRKGLHGQKRYYYVFSLGTEHEHRGKGRTLITHVTSPFFFHTDTSQDWQKLSCGITSGQPKQTISPSGSRRRRQAHVVFTSQWASKKSRRLCLGRARLLLMRVFSLVGLGFPCGRWCGGLSLLLLLVHKTGALLLELLLRLFIVYIQ